MKTPSVGNALKVQTNLARQRTFLANERTLLAHLKTGFAAIALGIALIQLFEEHTNFVIGGWISLLIGTLFIVLGIIYFPIRNKRIRDM